MGRICEVCQHPDRQAIDAALLNNEKLREIKEKYGPSISALHRHKEHLSTMALEAAGREKTKQLTVIVDQVIKDFKKVRDRFKKIANKAAGAGDLDAEISAMREVRATMTDTLKARGMWAPAIAVGIQVNNPAAPSFLSSPEYAIVMAILDRHPEVKGELLDALSEAGL
jgi:hypothetical protein